ncbi:hypothetical protein JHK85_023261 [Glycine max]|nr:hypothetical protein JHK85_023261 [Glycine max]
MGYSIPKDEQDGSFTSDAVANLIRLVMVVEKGRIYREKVKKVRHVFIIPNGDNVQKCVSNLVLKFHDDPTVNDFEIALFPRQVWWYAGKDRVFRGGEGKTKLKGKGGERLQCERYFSQLKHDIKIPNGENARNWATNIVRKLHNDPTMNKSEIVIFLRHVRRPTGKKEGFGRREKKRNCEAEEAEESV